MDRSNGNPHLLDERPAEENPPASARVQVTARHAMGCAQRAARCALRAACGVLRDALEWHGCACPRLPRTTHAYADGPKQKQDLVAMYCDIAAATMPTRTVKLKRTALVPPMQHRTLLHRDGHSRRHDDGAVEVVVVCAGRREKYLHKPWSGVRCLVVCHRLCRLPFVSFTSVPWSWSSSSGSTSLSRLPLPLKTKTK